VTVPFSGVSWTIVFPHITTIFLCPAALIPENPNAPLGALLADGIRPDPWQQRYDRRGTLTFAVICGSISRTRTTLCRDRGRIE
jgi:hypothetical protein